MFIMAMPLYFIGVLLYPHHPAGSHFMILASFAAFVGSGVAAFMKSIEPQPIEYFRKS